MIDNAKALADASFYGDRRAVDMVEALVTAVAAAPAAAKQSTARAVAASYADVNNEYQRFTAGQIFGGMITSTASSMATAAKVRVAAPITALLTSSGGTATEVVAAAHGLQTGQQVTISGSSMAALNGTHPVSVLSVNNFVVGVPFSAPASGTALGDWFRSDQVTTAAASNPAGQTAATEAIRIQVTAYNDQRALNALALVKAAMLEAALKAVFDSALLPEGARGTAVETAAVNAGRQALAERVPRYAVPAGAPSTEYNNFVRSATYAASAQKAAQAVAAAMVEEKATNALAGEASIKGKALAAALRALDAEFSAAARSLQTFVRVDPGPVGGGFGAGKGDARLTVDLSGTPLGGAALTAVLVLPASHPTNPFRHRRHPDHTQGFDITRKLRFDFDAVDPGTGTPAGFGVDRLTGVYREEIFGLHKPLGPDPVNNPIGLRVEGRFTLHRISLIDTLNAR